MKNSNAIVHENSCTENSGDGKQILLNHLLSIDQQTHVRLGKERSRTNTEAQLDHVFKSERETRGIRQSTQKAIASVTGLVKPGLNDPA